MTEPAKPVELDFKFMWCPSHLWPFKAEWPKSAALAMVNLFSASAADERIIAASGGDTNRLTAVLREHGPMCCFLPKEVTAAVVSASLAGCKYATD